jgi:hypothetical protein
MSAQAPSGLRVSQQRNFENMGSPPFGVAGSAFMAGSAPLQINDNDRGNYGRAMGCA